MTWKVPSHKPPKGAGKVHNPNERRPSAAKRGYGRNWRKVRARMLAFNPVCVRCAKKGLVVPANEVHHIIPKAEGGSDSRDNLECLCKACHSAETIKGLNDADSKAKG